MPSNSNSNGNPVTFCTRCQLPVDKDNGVCVQGMYFHKACCQCCVCRITVPDSLKFYFGRLFCEHCFARYLPFGAGGVPNNPSEFFKQCFENLRDANVQETFASFMHSGRCGTPIIHIHPSWGQCHRCGNTSTEE